MNSDPHGEEAHRAVSNHVARLLFENLKGGNASSLSSPAKAKAGDPVFQRRWRSIERPRRRDERGAHARMASKPMRPAQPKAGSPPCEARIPVSPSIENALWCRRDFALGKCRSTLFIKGLAVSL